jgi:hypothetical protein
MKKKIDTGKFFQKNEKSNSKNCPRFRRLCPENFKNSMKKFVHVN